MGSAFTVEPLKQTGVDSFTIKLINYSSSGDLFIGCGDKNSYDLSPGKDLRDGGNGFCILYIYNSKLMKGDGTLESSFSEPNY